MLTASCRAAVSHRLTSRDRSEVSHPHERIPRTGVTGDPLRSLCLSECESVCVCVCVCEGVWAVDPAQSFPEYYPACTSVAQLGSRADWVRLLSQLTHGSSSCEQNTVSTRNRDIIHMCQILFNFFHYSTALCLFKVILKRIKNNVLFI